MQRIFAVILMSLGTLFSVIVLVQEIINGKANNYHFYLTLIGFIGLFGGGWYNYYNNKTQKEIKVTDY